MIILVRKISFLITIISYAVLVAFIIIGSINYVPLPGDNTTVIFRTISEIIDNNTDNAVTYILFVTFYACVKFLLIGITLLDIDILHSELVERQGGIISDRAKSMFIGLSYVTCVLALFQIFMMIMLVYVPISKYYEVHMFVAALSFGSAIVKSFFYLVRRKILYEICSMFFISNVLYWLSFLTSAILFYIYRYGLIEYLLVLFILVENFFLVFEFFNLNFDFTIRLPVHLRKMPTRREEEQQEEEGIKLINTLIN